MKCYLCRTGKHAPQLCPLEEYKPLRPTGCSCHDACNEAWFRDHGKELRKLGLEVKR